MPGVGKKADAVADRSGVPLLYNLACLYRSLPHPEGKPFRFSLRVGETLLWTGKRVPERHTAPVGAEPIFLSALGTPCACCRRRSRSEPPDADHLM